MGATYEVEQRGSDEHSRAPTSGARVTTDGPEGWRLGQDIRFVLVAVGEGGVRIGREVARRHIRHLETVAINCDPKVQGFEEFDRRVYLGPDSGEEIDTGGSAFIGGVLARAAEPALERLFEGATVVVILGSLGGGAGSGALPHVLEVASRHGHLVSTFVVKPFRCEGERRALAERAVGRLHMVQSFIDKQNHGRATIQVLDNESLVHLLGPVAFSKVTNYWADVVSQHIQSSIIGEFEQAVSAIGANWTSSAVATDELSVPVLIPNRPAPEGVTPPVPPTPLPVAAPVPLEAELTIEVIPELRPREIR